MYSFGVSEQHTIESGKIVLGPPSVDCLGVVRTLIAVGVYDLRCEQNKGFRAMKTIHWLNLS